MAKIVKEKKEEKRNESIHSTSLLLLLSILILTKSWEGRIIKIHKIDAEEELHSETIAFYRKKRLFW